MMLIKCGNSFLNNSSATPSEAIIGSKLFFSSAFIIGMHLVA